MAPPTQTLRLAQIDPEALAREIAQQSLDHLHSSLLGLLGMDWTLRAPGGGRGDLVLTPIYQAVRALARYAVHGDELDAPVHEYLISLVPLWMAVIGQTDAEGIDDADPSTELGLIILAARARDELARKRPVSALQLATLAGVDAAHVRLLVRQGELRAVPDESPIQISARDAKRWLSSRGVGRA